MHPFPDKIDSLSGQEIFELQNAEGLTIWFSRYIHKDVCMDGVCKMISLWLFWDGAGEYFKLETPVCDPLTKSDHTEFEPEDYEKLESILYDTLSVLKDLKFSELIVEPEPDLELELDGISGATQAGLETVVVKDAVYTCYTLWHTVYGHTQTAINKMFDERFTHDYLKLLFESSDPVHTQLAIKSMEMHPEYHADFYPRIISVISSDNASLSEMAINYFRNERMRDEAVQVSLVKTLPDISPDKQNMLLWQFSEIKAASMDVVTTLLDLYVTQKIGIGTISLIYSLVQPNHLEDQRVQHILQGLESHENTYIRNLTVQVLNGGINLPQQAQ